ncbi:MAG: MFS transporter [Anaerolineaceae bacterium]|nr:MFS transporter [Anaerolineaceae bacterium]
MEPWYLTYTLQGAVIAGLLPILLPLAASHSGTATNIGLVMAALSLGGLTAPLWGTLADRYRLHRWLLVGGLLVTTIGLVAFTLTTQPAIRIGLALFLGLGAAGAATIANLFVVEAHPKSEWDERIGWLQTFYGVGQVGGLLLAGILSQTDLRSGLIVAAGLSGLAALLGWSTTKIPPNPIGAKPVLLHPAKHGEWVISSPQRLFHHLDWSAIQKLGPSLHSPFGLFLVIWLLALAGSTAFFSQYPVLMQTVFGIPPGISSAAFAVVAGVGLALYSPAGNWSERYGSARVIRTALGIRWLAYVSLFAIGFTHLRFQNWWALFAFAFVVCAWSLISVSGTTLAAQLSPVGEGEGLGIFNATNALAGVMGAALGGWVAGFWGYNFIAVVAVVGVALGLVLSLFLSTIHAKVEKQA